MSKNNGTSNINTDVVLIGAGIMSATLGTLLSNSNLPLQYKFLKGWIMQRQKVPTHGTMRVPATLRFVN
jgi:hypothetical protein